MKKRVLQGLCCLSLLTAATIKNTFAQDDRSGDRVVNLYSVETDGSNVMTQLEFALGGTGTLNLGFGYQWTTWGEKDVTEKTWQSGNAYATLKTATPLYKGESFTYSVEPRWYYRMKKRSEKGRDTRKNAAGYLSIQGTYETNSLLFSTLDQKVESAAYSVIPTWGIMRRTIFNFIKLEMSAGYGVVWDGKGHSFGIPGGSLKLGIVSDKAPRNIFSNSLYTW